MPGFGRVALAIVVLCQSGLASQERSPALERALETAGTHRVEFEKALRECAPEHRDGMVFLIENMPERDLETLTADFLGEHVEYAYRAWREAKWGSRVPREIFLNEILPYASINERRDAWRKDFYERFGKLVKDVDSPSRAAAILNQTIFKELGVKYSTKRPKADQSPYESIEAGLASCTGLSILLIDACRAVGVPARFVGTPRWADNSGNHSWVEVWDKGWHFTGAAEPTGDALNQAWFVDRARNAQTASGKHAIYAVSYRKTPLTFPLIWDSAYDDLTGVNVTDRYVTHGQELPPGMVRVRFRTTGSDSSARIRTVVSVQDGSGSSLFFGRTKDESFDANDHLTAQLPLGGRFRVAAGDRSNPVSRWFVVEGDEQLVNLAIPANSSGRPPAENLVIALQGYLATPVDKRPSGDEWELGKRPLTFDETVQAAMLLWSDRSLRIKDERVEEMKAKKIQMGKHELKFDFRSFGEAPSGGRSLFISMHGGGGAPAGVNDRQWENQKKLYEPKEGVYVAPRAPTDTWNLWHQGHIDPLFDRLITNMVLFNGVNPSRVYLMGYSAGGDGVYQLAPRMADRFAAAAMMAGHPNETSPLGLRNLPFTLHMGGDDAAYKRNEVAATWKKKLAALAEGDSGGYPHWVEIHEGKGHWMDRQDAAAVPWMAQFQRRTVPSKVVWVQDDVTHDRFYWLAVPQGTEKERTQVVATVKGQTITLESATVEKVIVRLRDDLVDLNQPIKIVSGGKTLFEGVVTRSLNVIAKTLAERNDPQAFFTAEVEVNLSAARQ